MTWWKAPVRPEDEPFLFAVYTGVRGGEVAAWGWDAAGQEAFLRMQFQVQQGAYALQYPNAEHSVIGVGERRVGRLILCRSGQEFRVVDIALLPEYRGAGIGTAVLRTVQQQAAGEGKPVRLQVLRGNRAGELYRRLGFVVTGESDLFRMMEWRPVSPI